VKAFAQRRNAVVRQNDLTEVKDTEAAIEGHIERANACHADEIYVGNEQTLHAPLDLINFDGFLKQFKHAILMREPRTIASTVKMNGGTVYAQ